MAQKYTILEVNGARVKVQYEDGNTRLVYIPASYTEMMIDYAVAQHHPDYVLTEDPNPLCVVGEERCTCDEMTTPEADSSTVADPYSLSTGPVMQYIDPMTLIFAALELDANGDSSVLDAMKAKAAAVIADPEFSAAEVVNRINDTL